MAGKVEFDTKQASKPPSMAKPQETVTITVGRGADSQTFKIHKDTLCYHSPFFATAFNGTFLEGKTQIIALDDVDGAAFGLLVAWLYTKTISDQDLEIEDQTEGKNPTPSSNVDVKLSEMAAKINALDSDEKSKVMAHLKALIFRGTNALPLAKL